MSVTHFITLFRVFPLPLPPYTSLQKSCVYRPNPDFVERILEKGAMVKEDARNLFAGAIIMIEQGKTSKQVLLGGELQ